MATHIFILCLVTILYRKIIDLIDAHSKIEPSYPINALSTLLKLY